VSVPPEIFGEDYFYFYDEVFAAERSDVDAGVVIALLALEPGMRVLDVPCGEGRIAGRLARHGCEVVGVDASAAMLARGREQYPEVRFKQGDIRALASEGEFDAIVNWFTSFGYFDPDTNDAILASFARALRPAGKLLLEYHNPWRLMRLMELAGGSSAYVVERGADLMVDRISYDTARARSITDRFTVRDGRVTKLRFTLEQVPAPQLVRRLQRAGFGEVALYGRGGGEFEPEGPRLIAVARSGDAAPPPSVSLRALDTDNVRRVCDLRLAPGQERYVAPSSYTVAEAVLHRGGWLRAICADAQVVGVLALISDPARPHPFLVRFMIGAQYQGRGYGRAALALVAEHARTTLDATTLETSCVPGTAGPTGFYLAAGFVATGEVWHGEDVLALDLARRAGASV